MNHPTLAAALLAVGLAASSVAAQTPERPPFKISASWSDVAPAGVTFDESGQPTALNKSDGQARFEASIPRGPIGQKRRGTLRANYEDGADVVVPIRLVEDRPVLAVAFVRAASVQCVKSVVMALERGSQDFQVTLKAYFQARELSTRSGPNSCGAWAKVRVRQAWVDRSYNLAQRNPQFLFDEEAATSLAQAAPAKTAYVENLRREAGKVRFQLLQSETKAAIRKEDNATALTLNGTLMQEFEDVIDSGKVEAPDGVFAGLSIPLLRKDRAFIQTRLNSQ